MHSEAFKVPFGNLQAHYLSYQSQIDAAIRRVLSSGHFILGSELTSFEEEFANYLGVRYVVGCASGTEAIYLALRATNIGAGDEVVVVAHTAVPTISAISMTGAEPVFVDIDPTTYVMDVSQVEAVITAKTKAIIPVHLYGQMVDMEPLLKLGSKLNIPVIEDVAQATGSTYKMSKAGTLGLFSAFSFYPSKNLGAFGDGGAICTNSQDGYERLLKLRNYGQLKRYYHDIIGINSRLDEIQAAILAAQLPYLTTWNERRREIAARYTKDLKNVVVTPSAGEHVFHVYHLYVIQTNDRDGLQKHLFSKGIQTLIHYPVPAHLQQAYKYRGYKENDLPVTESITKRILSLPMFPQLTDSQIDQVIYEICEYHKHHPAAQLVLPLSSGSTPAFQTTSSTVKPR